MRVCFAFVFMSSSRIKWCGGSCRQNCAPRRSHRWRASRCPCRMGWHNRWAPSRHLPPLRYLCFSIRWGCILLFAVSIELVGRLEDGVYLAWHRLRYNIDGLCLPSRRDLCVGRCELCGRMNPSGDDVESGLLLFRLRLWRHVRMMLFNLIWEFNKD